MTEQNLATELDGTVSSDGPIEDIVTSPNGFLSDKDSGGMFYVIRLA